MCLSCSFENNIDVAHTDLNTLRYFFRRVMRMPWGRILTSCALQQTMVVEH